MKKLTIIRNLTALIFCSRLVSGTGLDNQKEYNALCDIIQQLKNIQAYNDTLFTKDRDPILGEVLENISTTKELVFGRAEESAGSQGETTARQLVSEASPIKATTPFGLYHQQLTGNKISEIEEKLTRQDGLLSRFRALKDVARGECASAKKWARDALCGEDKQCTAGSDGFHAAGHTTDAGKSLANDLAWLCATESRNNNECVANTDQVGSAKMGNANQAKDMYEALVVKCPPLTEKVTQYTLERALHRFYGLLGLQVKDHASFASTGGAVLGKLDSGGANDCDASSHICLNYGTETAGKKEIPWVSLVRKLSEKWKIVIENAAEMNEIQREAKELQLTAWGEYKLAKQVENATFVESGTGSKAAEQLKHGGKIDQKETEVSPALNSRQEISKATGVNYIIPALTLLIV